MDNFLHQTLAGIATGSIYAALALAIVMIYRSINHINFAQGEMATFSTYLAWQGLQWGMPFAAALGFAVVVSIGLGAAIDRLLFYPLRHAPVLSQIVAFIALFALFNSVAGFIWGYDVREVPSPFGTGAFGSSGLISRHEAGSLAVIIGIFLLLSAFFRFTRIGLAMRGAADNPSSAKLSGVSVKWLTALGWGMAAGIGAIAGVLIAPVVFLEPNMMGGIFLYGLAAAVLGGLSSPLGAVVGGILVGVLENLSGAYVPVVGAELKLPIALVVIIVILTIRPAGLFGRRAVRRV